MDERYQMNGVKWFVVFVHIQIKKYHRRLLFLKNAVLLSVDMSGMNLLQITKFSAIVFASDLNIIIFMSLQPDYANLCCVISNFDYLI